MEQQLPHDILEKIRQQFDTGPYPRNPLESSPQNDTRLLFLHSFVTPYYLSNQKITQTEGKVILDAGCGTGYKALALAFANPGAKIVGIDISEKSVELARERLQYHGFDDAEFYPISIEELSQLEQKFDYINCDEVLTLLPNPVLGLQAMKSVLNKDGIIRANLHSSLQRTNFFRCQKLFKMMGLMNETPGELEVEIVREIMNALQDKVYLKQRTWLSERENEEQYYLMNYLLQGDKGFTIPEMFDALKVAGLDTISMVNWQQWDLIQLFKEPDNLPTFLSLSLPSLAIEDQLHIFELLHPVHRLLDFWCSHAHQEIYYQPVVDWESTQWQKTVVHLHPQLKTLQVKEDLINCITYRKPFEISRYGIVPATGILMVENNLASCLLPLWDEAQSVMSLVERWLKVRPLNIVTLEPVSEIVAFEEVKELLMALEAFLYVLFE